MQLLKPRSVPLKLRVYRSLNARMELSPEEKKYYSNLEKGYQGEVMFDQLTAKLQNNLYVINDLLLDENNTTFQIDTLLIAQKTIHPVEIKNFEGNYIYENGIFRKPSNIEIQNPLDQLKRSNSLLRQLLQKLRIQLPVDGYVSFVNPEFYLYQAPLNEPIIFPTQLQRFMKKFEQTPSQLSPMHKNIADQLISLHKKESKPKNVPPYEYGQLIKGIIDPICNHFMVISGNKKVVCPVCGHEEDITTAVLRSIAELQLLFPDKKITTNLVHNWCGIVESKRQISRILKENFKTIGYGQWSYYE